MNEFKWLIENVPVAAALIIMTKMWLSHLKTSSDDYKEVIRENTVVLGKVLQVMEKHLP